MNELKTEIDDKMNNGIIPILKKYDQIVKDQDGLSLSLTCAIKSIANTNSKEDGRKNNVPSDYSKEKCDFINEIVEMKNTIGIDKLIVEYYMWANEPYVWTYVDPKCQNNN
jgi:hypothetical protein